MKHCPKCHYDNADCSVKCEICQGAVSEVAIVNVVAHKKSGGTAWVLMLIGLILFGCGVFFIPGPPRAPGSTVQLLQGTGFTYAGVLYSLEKMKGLRFLPLESKRSVIALLYSPEEKVGLAAAELVGSWSRLSAEPGQRGEFFEALLKAAAESHGAARRQAAMEMGLSAAYGFPFAAYASEMRKLVAGLMKETDERLNAAGFFLAAMAGFSEYMPELENIILVAPSPFLKVYAACALSRLGGQVGHKYLFSIALTESEFGKEAMSCLSYSASPEALPFLEKAAAGKPGAKSVGQAKIALTWRKQLAIINR